MLKPLLARLEREGLSAYLETHNERNIALYRHFGFEVVAESTLLKYDTGNVGDEA